jgi:hypothetical protein
MKQTLLIDGGLGRNVCAIPALEKFVAQHPDATIISNFWTAVFWGNKKLQSSVFDASTKNLFKLIKDTKIKRIEPYYNSNFLNEKINLVQAFDEEINQQSENLKPNLYLSYKELHEAKKVFNNGNKVIAFQPFGSSAVFCSNEIYDETARSLNLKMTVALLEAIINEGYRVLVFDDRRYPFFERKGVITITGTEYRSSMAFIAEADYFLGVDSSGQHIARAFEKPGAVFFGGTSNVNFGYPDWFTSITRPEYESREYPPIRVSEFDFWISNIANKDLLNFTEAEIPSICDLVLTDIKNKIGSANNQPKVTNERL